MKSFDSPGDVKRAFQFIRKKTWEDATPMDRAVFVSMLQNIPAAFTEIHSLTAGEIAAGRHTWEWFTTPADLGDVSSPATSLGRRHYWNGGIKLPLEGQVNGWYFLPFYIMVEFFTSAGAPKAARIGRVISRMRGALDPKMLGPALGSAERIIAFQDIVANTKEVEVFARGNHDHVGADVFSGELLETVLLPYKKTAVAPTLIGEISFDAIASLVATDILRITMEGRFFFSPALIEEYTVADD